MAIFESRKRLVKMNRVASMVLGLAFGCAGIAQDKVTVPLSNPSQPATLKVHLIFGSITVTAGSGSQIVVEPQGGSGPFRGRSDRDNAPPGMHRIDGGGQAFNVEEDRNVVTINPERGGQNMNFAIQVPVNTSV